MKELIMKYGVPIDDIASALKISRQALYGKLRGEYPFTARELVAMRYLFHLDDAEFVKLVMICGT